MSNEIELSESQVQIHFEMSQGEGQMMYTLWRVTQSKIKYSRRFVQNLSTDKEQAWAKALTLAGPYELEDDSMNKLRDIIRNDSGLISFGKHRGTPVIELEDGYLSWIAQGAPIEVQPERRQSEDYTYTKYLASDFEKKLAIEEGLKRGILGEYKGQILNVNYIKKLVEKDEMDARSQHFGTPGEKFTKTVTFEKRTYFDNEYGTTWVNVFRDTDGNVILHMGTFINVKDEYESPELGKQFQLSGTIKEHSEYQGVKQTRILRPKLFNI